MVDGKLHGQKHRYAFSFLCSRWIVLYAECTHTLCYPHSLFLSPSLAVSFSPATILRYFFRCFLLDSLVTMEIMHAWMTEQRWWRQNSGRMTDVLYTHALKSVTHKLIFIKLRLHLQRKAPVWRCNILLSCSFMPSIDSVVSVTEGGENAGREKKREREREEERESEWISSHFLCLHFIDF